MEQQIIGMWAQLGLSGLGLGAIFWGLVQMRQAGRRRDQEIDVLAETMRESTRALERQGQTLGQALERQGQALERQGQALERQGQALERQGQTLGQALERQSQALERQSQVLAELLRRSA